MQKPRVHSETPCLNQPKPPPAGHFCCGAAATAFLPALGILVWITAIGGIASDSESIGLQDKHSPAAFFSLRIVAAFRPI